MSDERDKGFDDLVPKSPLSRREFLRIAGLTGAVVGASGGLVGVVAGCGGSTTTTAGATGREIKLGYVTPQTGPLAGFSEPDGFIIEGVMAAYGAGLTIGGTTHPVKIVVKDSQSNPNRAAEVAGDLILNEGVDLMLVQGTPETTNPVSDQCEANGTPCLSTLAPWQPWFFRSKTVDPKVGYQWTYHFLWGLEDIIAVFNNLWNQLETNKTVGALWPNDGDGNAWGDAKLGFPPALTKAGYKIVDPGRFQDLTDDFSSQIAQFKSASVEIVTGVPIPPDFTTFWKQSLQQGFHPKIASVGKALLFPSSVEALGTAGDGMSTEVWWTPTHPFASSLTKETAAQLADSYTAKTSKQWTQPLGFIHALFEISADVLTRTTDIEDKQAIITAIKATDLQTIVGPINWAKGPVPNVAKTPLVGGQWGKGTNFPYEMIVVDNQTAPEIPVGGKLRPIPYT